MPIFIERPDPIANAISQYLSVAQINRLNKSVKDYEDRKRKQKLTALIGGAALGGLGGLALAPAAVASAGAGSGFAAGTALTAAGVPALAGQVTGTLTGAALGSQFAGQIADEDIAGALGTAARTATGIVQNLEDRRAYGYTPTPQEKSALAKAAVEAGTTLGALTKESQRSGVSVGQLLAAARATQEGRRVALAGETEFAETAAHLKANQEAAIRSNLYDFVPDQKRLAQVQADKEWVIENMRPPSGGGEPALSMTEGQRMLGEIAQREDFLLSNPVRVPKKNMIPTEVGELRGGESRRIGTSDWQITAEVQKSGTITPKYEKTVPHWQTLPIGSAERAAERKAWEDDQIHVIDGKKYKRTKDDVLDEVDKPESDEVKPMSYKEARAIAFREMPKEVYPDSDTERAGLPKPINLEDLHENTLDLMRRSREVQEQPPPSAAESVPAQANPELDALIREGDSLIGTYGDYDQMPPEEQQRFDAILARYKALGGS